MVTRAVHGVLNTIRDAISSPEEINNRKIVVAGLSLLKVALKIDSVAYAVMAVLSASSFLPVALGLFGAYFIWELSEVVANYQKIIQDVASKALFDMDPGIVYHNTPMLSAINSLIPYLFSREIVVFQNNTQRT